MNTNDQKQEYPERKNEKKFSAVKVILGAVAGFTLLAAMILSNVQQLQLTNEIAAKQKEYTDMQSENVRMQTELAGKASNKNVQEYAENVLGMHVLNPSQVEYIQIQTADVVEIPEEEQSIFVKIKNAFDHFIAYMRG
jgi:cell division protein FtsL